MKGGSETLAWAPSVPVEKVFVLDIKSMYPKDEDIALVKLQRPLSAPGESQTRWAGLWGTDPLRVALHEYKRTCQGR